MPVRDDRAPVWAIWLLIAFGAAQPLAWLIAGGALRRPVVALPLLVVWIVLVVLASIATRRIMALWNQVTQVDRAHKATLGEIEQLQTQAAMLEIVARSVDVPLAFQALASRIARLVACDRVGLALLSEDGREFQTFTARVQDHERRSRPRPEIVFRMDRTLIGSVVRAGEPLILGSIDEVAPDYLDANVLYTAGFRSLLILPLVSKGRAVGTLNVVSRQAHAFAQAHVDALQSIAEILAVAWVAQQLQMSIGKYRTMEVMSEVTLSIAAEINSALQTIVGHCDLIERSHPDPALQRDLATVVRQAQRIADLLEKMRAAAHERMREVADTMHQEGIPSSPEEWK